MSHTYGHWYLVSSRGLVTQCKDKADAEAEAVGCDAAYPHHAPHRVMQLVDAAELERFRALASGQTPIAPANQPSDD